MPEQDTIQLADVVPFLTERGRVELDFAIQSYRVHALQQENQQLRNNGNTGVSVQPSDDG